MGNNKTTILRMTSEERDVLLTLLSTDVMGAIHAIVTAPQLDPKIKTFNIIKQLDWVFDLRAVLRQVPEPDGVIWLSDFCRWYCDKLLAGADPTNYELDQKALFYKVYRSLKPKIVDVTAASVADEELTPDPKAN